MKHLMLCHIPMSICNFRCHYCYLSQREISFEGNQIEMKYSPEFVAKALSKERLGGICLFNFCAEGETLLAKNIDEYIKAIVENGHYAEIVTNMTITPVIKKILSWESDLLKRVAFKCSFHYLELKKKNLLETFCENVNDASQKGASINVEVTPSDELVPFIDDVKKYSLEHFGALPHITIARDDSVRNIDYLTKLDDEKYEKIWSSFNSDFWAFKRTVFGEKRKEFCYAGMYSMLFDFVTGDTKKCYSDDYKGNIYDLEKPVNFEPIGVCPEPHCFNGHALLSLGCIRNKFCDYKYGNIRNRVRLDGTNWFQDNALAFFNSRLDKNNTALEKKMENRIVRNYKLKKFAKSPFKLIKKYIRRFRF